MDVPDYFKNICSTIDQFPLGLDFNIPPLSEVTGLSQDLGNLTQSDSSYASIPDQQASQSSVDPTVQGILLSHLSPSLWAEVDRWRPSRAIPSSKSPLQTPHLIK